jgi:hypothetical protein
VVLADFAQLAPDRAATIVVDPKNPKRIDIAVTGLTYTASTAGKTSSEMEVSVETNPAGGDTDLGWIPAPEGIVGLRGEAVGGTTVWRGQIRLDRMKLPKLQAIQLVIKEYELFLLDSRVPLGPAVAALPPTAPARRLVYADVLRVPGLLSL